jgi:hypothetical protein
MFVVVIKVREPANPDSTPPTADEWVITGIVHGFTGEKRALAWVEYYQKSQEFKMEVKFEITETTHFSEFKT